MIASALVLNALLAVPASTQEAPRAAVEPASQDAVAVQPTSRPAPQDDAYDLGEVSVVTTRRGAVQGDIEPDIVLTAEDLQVYGAGNIGELLTALAPLTQSTRGRGDSPPVTLLNGRRISGPREIHGIPREAIERVDILPEEVALSYGYRADQRVVNFVLKPQFRAVTTEAGVRVPTQGGRSVTQIQNNLFNVNEGRRYSLDLNLQRDTAIYETERDIVRNDDGGPFSRAGTVTGLTPGAEIDPALSALAGAPVLTARAPASAAAGSVALQDFVAGAGLGGSDQTAWRTLSPESDQAVLRGSLKLDLDASTAMTVSAELQDTDSLTWLGLPGVALTLPSTSVFSPFGADALMYRSFDRPDALSRSTDTRSGNAGVVLDGFLADWRWTFNGKYERTETDTRTGRGLDATALQAAVSGGDPTLNPFGDIPEALLTVRPADTARSLTSTAGAELVLNGDLFELPAGDLRSTFTLALDSRSLESESVRSGVLSERSLSRDRAALQGNFDLPIARKDREVLAGLGDLSLGLNLGYEELSDFGGLYSVDGVVNWSPTDRWSFLASYTVEQGAPSIQQLNDPVLQTPNVPVFDFATGQTVSITRIEGGNPGLSADERHVQKLGVTLKPFSGQNLTFSSTWTRSDLRDQIATFPTITPALEAALPERFVRDADGQLVSIDVRPLNYARAEKQDLRTGFTLMRAFGKPTPLPPGADRRGQGGGRGPGGFGGGMMIAGPGGPGGPSGGSGAGRGGPGGGMMRMQTQPGQGTINLSVFHTWRIQDEVTIRDDLPVLDLLDGQSVSGRGGQPRHEIQANLGVFRNGFGGFMNATWRASTRVEGGAGGEDLFFSDQTTVNLNLFADLSARTAWVERFPVLKGSRVSLGIENLFDDRLEVRDAQGAVPLGYQADYLDPVGRTVRINLRKQF